MKLNFRSKLTNDIVKLIDPNQMRSLRISKLEIILLGAFSCSLHCHPSKKIGQQKEIDSISF